MEKVPSTIDAKAGNRYKASAKVKHNRAELRTRLSFIALELSRAAGKDATAMLLVDDPPGPGTEGHGGITSANANLAIGNLSQGTRNNALCYELETADVRWGPIARVLRRKSSDRGDQDGSRQD